MGSTFDEYAEAYDSWYDAPEGQVLFTAERDCFLHLYGGSFDGWLEVGVGTGRFAQALGITNGIDPSPKMLEWASGRGIETCLGSAESLPFADGAFDGVLMALTLCFVSDAALSLKECYRVLRPGGYLLLGFIPSESAWGREYKAKAERGHPFYAHASFQTVDETLGLVQPAGFLLCGCAGTLYCKPGQLAGLEPRIGAPCGEEAGFAALLAQKPGTPAKT